MIFLILHTGAEAKKLFDEAQKMLEKIQIEKLFTCKGVVGIWQASRRGDDIDVIGDDGNPIATFHGLRQQVCRNFFVR